MVTHGHISEFDNTMENKGVYSEYLEQYFLTNNIEDLQESMPSSWAFAVYPHVALFITWWCFKSRWTDPLKK